MKLKMHYLILSVFVFFMLANMETHAQNAWGSYYEYTYESGTTTIELTENLKIYSPIRLKNGATLIIKNVSNQTLTISNGLAANSSTTCMFKVDAGATLKILGRRENNKDYKIIIDGGADFPEWSSSIGFDTNVAKKTLDACIVNQGYFTLEYGCIQNVCALDPRADDSANRKGGAININGTSCSKTNITHSIIRKCQAAEGSAILIDSRNTGSKAPEDCKVTIRYSKIHYCHASADAGGGTIRTYGSTVANLHMYGDTLQYNKSRDGAGLYWNAHGHKDTKCTIDGCIFRHNFASHRGGGVMLETSFEFKDDMTERQTVISDNYASSYGGGIVITGYNGGLITGGNMEMRLNDKLKVTNNKSGYGGGIGFYFDKMSFTTKTNINAIIDGCEISNNTATISGGAISFRNYSGNRSDQGHITIGIKMDSGLFENNTAVNYGGALHVENTNIGYTSPQSEGDVVIMRGNTVTSAEENNGNGGALYLEKGSLTMGRTLFNGNSATRDGGAVYVTGGTLTTEGTSTIQDNIAGNNGGGLWIGGNFVVAENKEISFDGNTAKNGGGAYVQGAMTVKGSANVDGNTASDSAGGIYVKGGNLTVTNNSNSSSIEIINNSAANKGGGIVVEAGNIVFNKADISNNRAGYDSSREAYGGAICLTDGSITIDEGSIHDNYSTKYGGAIYASNSDFSKAAKTISLLGSGLFQKNNASYGGGLYVSGNIDMTFAGSVVNNNAVNGGGIFLSNGAKLKITGGIIKQNIAKGLSGQEKPVTGYQSASANVHGVGGGVFLDSGYSASRPTNLIFELTGTSIGLYDNDADWGADAIFANGNNTSVTIPNINQMTFTNFDTPADTPLFWAEDYIKDDPNYGYGTKENKSWDSSKTNERHDFAIRNSMPAYHISFGESETTKVLKSYLSLDVGYEMVFITLVKKGLYPGENAIFTFTPATKKISDTEYEVETGTKPYRSVIFKCTNNNQTTGGVVRRVAIPYGWWKIDETTWSWTYDEDNADKYDKPILIDNDNKEFEFSNVRRSDVPTTSEAIVTNRMKSSIQAVSEED